MKSLVSVKRWGKGLILPCLVALLSVTVYASDFSGEVVRVIDGDTVVVLDAGKQQVRVRLAEIDAPEKRQAFGEVSRQALATMAYRKQVKVIDKGLDRYGRTLGILHVDGKDLNAAMVAQGMAWVYRQYSTDAHLLSLENDARSQKLGLWNGINPVAPWVYRKK